MATYVTYVDANRTPPGSGLLESPYTTMLSGVNDILTSGLVTGDIGVIIIASGTYSEDISFVNPSGTIIFQGEPGAQLDSIDASGQGMLLIDNLDLTELDSSGSLSVTYQNGTLGVSGSATSSFLDVSGVKFDFVTIDQPVTVDLSQSLDASHISVSGLTNGIFVSGVVNEVKFISGFLGHGSGNMLSVTDSSGVVIDRLWGCHYSGGAPVFIDSCSGFVVTHNTFVNKNGHTIEFLDSSGQMKWSIFAASGQFPVSGEVGSYIDATGSILVDYASIGTANPDVSGSHSSIDPLITDIDACDLRLRATSPVACAAEPIPELIDATLVDTEFTLNSVKYFDASNPGVLATTPSGAYIVQAGRALFLPSQSGGIEDDITVVVNARYTVDGSATAQQSYQSEENENSAGHLYDKDYTIVPRMNYKLNKDDYRLQPFTIIPLDNMISGTVLGGIRADNVAASGLYELSGLSYDSTIHQIDNLKVYWALERNNGYLYKYAASTDRLVETYPLFAPDPNASGINKTVRPADMETLSHTAGGARVLTTKFLDRDSIGTVEKIIDLNDRDQEIEWNPADIDKNKRPLCLLDVDDNLYIMVRSVIETDDEPEVSIDMHVYNKFERDFPSVPSKIVSGVLNPSEGIPTDMTMDDVGNIYISTSGRIDKFTQHYDYAFVNKTDGAVRSTVILREKYNEVSL